MNETTKPTGCCPPFNSEPWQDKEITWQDKLFVKDHVTSFLRVPLNMNAKMIKNMKLIEQARAKDEQTPMLSDEKSLWGADIYISVTRDVPGAEMAKISGVFLTKVFEGPYKNAGMWARNMKECVKAKGREIKKLYFAYATCPRCAKIYGKNYVVLLARV